MEFIYDGYLYSQRTSNSKVLKIKDGIIVDRFESIKELPSEILDEYNLIKIMTETPEKFFYYEKKYNKIEITNSIAKGKSRNIIIPEILEGLPVMDFANETNLFKNAEYVVFLNDARYFPTHLFQENINLRYVKFGKEMKLSKGDFIYKKNLETIIIPENATEIPENFCYGCSSLKNINLDNITKIKNAAFCKCINLDVEIPENIEEIGIKGFYNSGIKNIFLPKTLKKIGDYAFAECKQIEFIYRNHIEIPPNLFLNSSKTYPIEDLLR